MLGGISSAQMQPIQYLTLLILVPAFHFLFSLTTFGARLLFLDGLISCSYVCTEVPDMQARLTAEKSLADLREGYRRYLL